MYVCMYVCMCTRMYFYTKTYVHRGTVYIHTYYKILLPLPLRFIPYLSQEHIIPNLVVLLRENIRMDSRLKRRLIAALGETIFYISAQEEDSQGGGSSNGSTHIFAVHTIHTYTIYIHLVVHKYTYNIGCNNDCIYSMQVCICM